MDDRLQQLLERCDLLEYWDSLLQAYKEMGFTDELTDEERIKEFTEIISLMNEWIKKVEKVVTPHWPYNKDDGIEAFKAMSCKTKLDTRIKIVYAELRDRWNDAALNKLELMLLEDVQQWAQEEKEDNDGRDKWKF